MTLGTLAARVRPGHIAPLVADRAVAVTLDVLAAAVSGLAHADVAALRVAVGPGGDGPASVVGRRAGACAALAAYLNAAPIAREQWQDGHRRARGHPASHVVPAVLAVAESVDASGQAALAAVLAGYETGVRIGVAMDGTSPGVHDIGTWAGVGATVGVTHLLTDGDPAALARAVDVAAALALLPDAATVFGGHTAQNLLLPTSVAQAVTNGQAAAAGLQASPGALERHFAAVAARDPDGFVTRLMGLIDFRTEDPGDWMVLDGYLKRHPTCALLHGVNDAVEDLVVAEPLCADEICADEIVSIRVRTYAAAAAFDEPAPQNELHARFSIPWTVAAGTVLGGLSEAFSPRALADPSLLALAARVYVEHDAALDPGYPAGRPAVVSVHLRDGRVVSAASRGAPRGDGPSALDDPTIAAKPVTLLSVGGADWADEAIAAVSALTDGGSARDLGEVLRRADVAPSPGRTRRWR
ncbi:MmgE/PrpD family protein [Gordonia sp. CPCC 206044]|uniref:MmgE/PrpD family protein n=1 Tax=Gordonia sp. CPCC 206044 TaxID=3140793 RepID=UPI003AF33A5C